MVPEDQIGDENVMNATDTEASVPRDRASLEMYFPTLLFKRDLADADIVNDELTQLIRAERDADQKGIVRSNVRELGGWHSKNNLHRREEFNTIHTRILAQAQYLSDKLGYHPDFKLVVDGMWSIINGPGSFNRAHIHPGSLWSGVYYVAAPKDCGDIQFTDPRTEHLIRGAKFKKDAPRPRECWTKVHFTPTPGKMIMFPSWLYHSVAPNMTEAEGLDAERIIISFNLSQIKKAGTS